MGSHKLSVIIVYVNDRRQKGSCIVLDHNQLTASSSQRLPNKTKQKQPYSYHFYYLHEIHSLSVWILPKQRVSECISLKRETHKQNHRTNQSENQTSYWKWLGGGCVGGGGGGGQGGGEDDREKPDQKQKKKKQKTCTFDFTQPRGFAMGAWWKQKPKKLKVK